MKILGRKLINYPAERFPGTYVRQIGDNKFTGKTNTFIYIYILSPDFQRLYVLCRGITRSLNCCSGLLSCCNNIFLSTIVSLKDTLQAQYLLS